MPACGAAGTAVAFLSTVVADAGAGVIFAAIWAMNVPSPIMIAAKIIMLRMTLHTLTRDIRKLSSQSATKLRLTRPAKPAFFAKRMSEALMACLRFPAA